MRAVYQKGAIKSSKKGKTMNFYFERSCGFDGFNLEYSKSFLKKGIAYECSTQSLAEISLGLFNRLILMILCVRVCVCECMCPFYVI